MIDVESLPPGIYVKHRPWWWRCSYAAWMVLGARVGIENAWKRRCDRRDNWYAVLAGVEWSSWDGYRKMKQWLLRLTFLNFDLLIQRREPTEVRITFREKL